MPAWFHRHRATLGFAILAIAVTAALIMQARTLAQDRKVQNDLCRVVQSFSEPVQIRPDSDLAKTLTAEELKTANAALAARDARHRTQFAESGVDCRAA